MDMKSGYPFWAVKNGLMHAFPPLREDLRCDIAVIGGGITGALIAHELATHGHQVAVFEQRDIGWGSTCASTALLQYEIDTHMIDLAKRYGEDTATLAYRSCCDALDMLGTVARDIRDVDYARMDSLYYASKQGHVTVFHNEYAMRARHGLDVELLDAARLQQHYGIDAPVAILSRQAARIDPYRLTYRLLAKLQRNGCGIHDRTPISRLQANSRGVVMRTESGATIRASHAVIAAGYAGQQWLKPRVARNRSSYAFITDPLGADAIGALKNTMVWESARPYLYLRSTGDRRILIGGEDDRVDVPARRDRRVDWKARLLCRKVGKAIPGLAVKPAFAWAGTFAETIDGLPFFGPHKQHGSRLYFAMAYGGNGIIYSMLGAGLVRALIEKRRHRLEHLFAFARIG